MRIGNVGRLIGIGALATTAVALAACTGGRNRSDDPIIAAQQSFTELLRPSGDTSTPLSVAQDAVREVLRDGAVVGSYDGTRYVEAADTHEFGTPTGADPEVDVQGDGLATPREQQQVIRHFDTDGTRGLSPSEWTAFTDEVGITWSAAGSGA